MLHSLNKIAKADFLGFLNDIFSITTIKKVSPIKLEELEKFTDCIDLSSLTFFATSSDFSELLIAKSGHKHLAFSFIKMTKELNKQSLISLTKAINKDISSYNIIFFYDECSLHIAFAKRRLAKNRTIKTDVLDKIVVIKDINLQNISHAHEKNLESIKNISAKEIDKFYDEILETLSIEKLNTSFYKEILGCFKAFVESISLPNNANEDEKRSFTLRLISRILFCKFLEKKGLIKPEIWDISKDDYYHEVLEPLFFESLNTPKENRKYDFVDENIKAILQEIPYLNGGLFSPCELDFYNAKNPHSFTLTLKVPFKPFSKLFAMLKKYHFTIDEGSLKYEEVALDPELLGRIFESILSELFTDNKIDNIDDKSVRKATGSFYTPREIVSYMVKESLKLHLQKSASEQILASLFDEAEQNEAEQVQISPQDKATILQSLKNVKILDPACGSGAFPMGILNEILALQEKLGDESPLYERKLAILQNSIYGVDIQEMAIEISRLRAFLSLIIDENIKDIKPLPNLDFKFMQGNALISTICGREIIPNSNENKPARKIQKDLFGNADIKELDKTSLFDETRADKIKMLFNAYFSQNDLAEKHKLKFEILSQMKEVFDERIKELDTHIKALKTSITKIGLHVSTDTKSKQEKDLKEFAEYENFKNELLALLDDYKKQDFHSEKLFLYEFFFADIMQSGGFDIVIGNPPYIQLQKDGGKLAKLYEKQNFKSLTKTGDIYQLFYEKSLNLLNEFGVVSLITSNKWMRAGYGSTTREYFYNNADVFKLIDLGAGVFKSATVDTNIIFYGKSKEKINGERLFNALNFKGDLSDLYLTGNTNETIKALESKEWVIMDENERSIFEKMSKHKALKDWDINIYRGVVTGFNEAFIIDEETKNRLIKEDKKSSGIIKPILRGRDIKRYSYDFKNLYLINTHNGLKEKNISPVDINEYPAIKKHLDKYYSHLQKRQDKGRTPYNLRNCAYLEDFEKEKIVYQEICSNASYSFDNTSSFIANTAYMMTSSNYNLKVLLGLLNSKLYWWFFTKNNISLGGSGVRMLAMFIEKLPIPKPDTKTQKEIVSLVDKIIEGKKNGINTSELEKQIDSLVYELYGLSEEERKIIENK